LGSLVLLGVVGGGDFLSRLILLRVVLSGGVGKYHLGGRRGTEESKIGKGTNEV